jgi:hypothetical protein
MKIASVKIKCNYGELSAREYYFHTSMYNLNKGDVVTVFGQYGLQLAVFEKYVEPNFFPKCFVIDKISGKNIVEKIAEQKSLLLRNLEEQRKNILAL